MVALLLAACTPDVAPEDTAPPAPIGPNLALDAEVVDFGGIRLGGVGTGTLTLSNVGDDTLTLQTPVLEDPAGPFEADDLATIYLLAGDTLDLALTFTAEVHGTHATRLLIPSDDPDTPLSQVVLVGSTTAPVVTLEPSALDFGAIEQACTDLASVLVRNDGDEALIVTEIEESGGDGAFAVDIEEGTNGPLPWALAPGESRTVWVSFAPERGATYDGGLIVRTDDAANLNAAVTLDGEGTPNARVTDVFTTLGKPLDLVFAVGGADSEGLADSLLAALPNLTEPLVEANVSFQIGAILADDGCLLNGLLVNGTMTPAEQASAFAGLLATSGTEHTLTLLERALGESGAEGCNDDLVRDSAQLVLVGLTDTAGPAPQAHGVYTATFEATKTDTDDVSAWFIGPDGGDCGVADTAWDEVTAATGGSSLSVCDDLPTTLASLADAITHRQEEFPLSKIPWPDRLAVWIDDEPTSDWTYDTSTNAVVFDEGYAPTIGSEVRVFYYAVPLCDAGE